MRRIIQIVLLSLALPVAAQTTSVTATLTDSDSVTWVNGSCTATLVYKKQSPIVLPYLNAGGNVPLSPNCTVNGLGQLNAGLTDVAFIAPIFEATWQFTICPNVGPRAACGTVNIPVTGASQDVSSLLALPPPRVGGGIGATAYADIEVSAVFNNLYWNIVSNQCRQYGTSWTTCAASSGGGSVTNFIASSGSWPSWLAPSVSSSSTTPTLAVTASPIPNSALANNSITFGGAAVALGATATTGQQTITINSIPCALGSTCSVTSAGVSSINSTTGAFTFSFSGGAGSCSGTTCTFTGAGTGGGSVTNFIASSAGWPTWLVPSVATSTTTPALTVAAGPIPNAALANSAVTIGSTSVSLGATATAFAGLTTLNSITLPTAAGAATFTQTICSGTVALGTSAIASGAAASTVTASCSGLLSTDDIQMDFNGSPLAVTGYVPSATGMLTIVKWPSANTINVAVVNNTQSPISPGAITLNFRAVR